jgi:threonine aldolase
VSHAPASPGGLAKTYGEVRWMTAFDTTEEHVDEFAEAITAALTSR